MQSSMDEANVLLERIDRGGNLEQVRRDIAVLILRCLTEKQDTLDAWEKMQFEMAIALLPTYWLRLAVAHIKLAMEPADAHLEMDAAVAAGFAKITKDELVARLANVVWSD